MPSALFGAWATYASCLFETIGVETGGGLLREKNFVNFGVCIAMRKKQFNFGGPNVIYSDLRCMYAQG